MPRLILHVGAHKTGTSYLQSVFYQNRAVFERSGVYYPAIGPNDAHHALAAVWLNLPDIPARFFGRTGPEGLWQRTMDDLLKRDGTVFLSAENFTRATPQQVDMADLARRLSGFDEVRVVYVMRRQVEMVQSLWLQVAKTRQAPTLRAYVARAFNEGLAGGIPIDHGAVYRQLLQGFAPEQIVLMDYDQVRRGTGGILGAFLDLMGVQVDPAALRPVTEVSANISPDPLATFVASRLMGQQPPPQRLVDFVLPLVHPQPQRHTTLLTRREYDQINRKFRRSNAALVAAAQAVQPGFAFGESDAPKDMIYRDNMTAETWARVAESLYQARNLPRTAPRLWQRFLDICRR